VSGTVAVRRFGPGEWRRYRDLRLAALADSPDAFGSTLERELQSADSEWAERLVNANRTHLDLPLVAELQDQAIGLAWVNIDAAERTLAHLYQMWVVPAGRRRGAGRALLQAAIEWAEAAGVGRLNLRATCGTHRQGVCIRTSVSSPRGTSNRCGQDQRY
jgi:GNAT superfamily N-acetyltransferase